MESNGNKLFLKKKDSSAPKSPTLMGAILYSFNNY